MPPFKISPSNPSWPPAITDPAALQAAFHQAHSAVQWPARMVNSYNVPASDGSHLHMVWDPGAPAIVSQPFAGDMRVEMRLPAMILQFTEDGVRTKHEIELDDRSPAQVEAWTLIELLHRHIDRDVYTKVLPYDVSHLLSGDARDYQTTGNETAFQEMTFWLSGAGDVLRTVLQEAEEQRLGEVTPVLFAPETFSVFARVHPASDRPAVGNYVEIGFCAGTSDDGPPHFYRISKAGDAKSSLSITAIAENGTKLSQIAEFFAVPEMVSALK